MYPSIDPDGLGHMEKINYVLIGKQRDDLPIFSKILDFMIIVDYPVVEVNVCRTTGLANHLMSYQVESSLLSHCVSLLSLPDGQPHTACTFDDGNIYITLRSHVEIELLEIIE